MTTAMPVLAGHSDFVAALAGYDQKAVLTGSTPGAVPAADLGLRHGVVAGLYEVLVPPTPPSRLLRSDAGIEVEYPPRLDPGHALTETMRGISALRRLARAADSPVRVATTLTELTDTIHAGRFAAILHLADADAIDPELHALDVLHDAGLRSLAITWSRSNAFGYGVPYRAPGHPDIGPGLTPDGHALVRRCNELGIMIDLAHLNLAGFLDVAHTSTDPLVVTHGAAHTLSPTTRALTDQQLELIARSGGVVGVSLEGVPPTDAGIVADLTAQLHHLLDVIGPSHVALGSDVYRYPDPEHPGGHSHIPELLAALARDGLDTATVTAISYGNWRRVLAATWNN